METLAAWIPSLLISLVAVAAFLFLAFQSRKQIDRLQNTLRQNAEQLVAQFLERERDNTERYLQDADDSTPAARVLPQMRRCWLDAELAALVDRGHGNSDFDAIRQSAAPLLRIAQPGANAEKSPSVAQESRQYLQRTREAVASQKKFIEEFRSRAARLGKKSQPADESAADTETSAPSHDGSGFIASMQHMEASTIDLLKTIERLEQELASVQTKYDIIKGKLTALEAIKATRSATVRINERLAAPDKESTRSDSDLLLDMESAYTNSINEMKKMSDINRQQRHLILQMEKELSLLRKGSDEQGEARDVLDKLKLQLRDYENCTTILEMESETLREQIQSLRRAIETPTQHDDAAATATDAAPTPQPAADSGSTSGKSQGIPVALLGTIVGAESLEQAAQRLVEWLREQHVSSVIFAKGNREQAWAASEGSVDDHSRQLLKSMVPAAGAPILEVREGVMFILPTCRILLYGKGDFHERGHGARQFLLDVFTAVDHLISLLEERLELRQQHRRMEKIQQKVQSLLVQYNYVDSEYTRTHTEFRSELEEFLSTSNLSDVQRQCIETMLGDFDSQLEILSRTGKLIGNGLRASTQELSQARP